MAINYEDERLLEVEKEKQEALTEAEETYGSMIEKTEQLYQEQIDATHAWEEQQKQLQQEQTDFAVQEAQRQKEQREKDYTREQSAAYADWQKQKNAYGVEAERMATAGLAGSGFAESSQVSMYNTYQLRVAAARESMQQAITEFDSAIQAAMLQNNVAMAQIAAEALQKRLALSLEGFQYQNQLILSLEQEKQAIDQTYYSRWQDVLAQLNAEEAMNISREQESSNGGYFLEGEEEATGGDFTLSETAIKNMQLSLGVPQTGVYDEATRKAANGMSLEEAWKAWNKGQIGKSLNPGMQNRSVGSWRQQERGTSYVAEGVLKGLSEEKIEEMIASGDAYVEQSGGNIVVRKTAKTAREAALYKYDPKTVQNLQTEQKEKSEKAKAGFMEILKNAIEGAYRGLYFDD